MMQFLGLGKNCLEKNIFNSKKFASYVIILFQDISVQNIQNCLMLWLIYEIKEVVLWDICNSFLIFFTFEFNTIWIKQKTKNKQRVTNNAYVNKAINNLDKHMDPSVIWKNENKQVCVLKGSR